MDLCVSDVSILFSLDVRPFVVKFIPLGCGTLFRRTWIFDQQRTGR